MIGRKTILRICVITGLFLFAACTCHGAGEDREAKVSPERLFGRGNDYYEKGEYDKAAEEYGKVLAEGYESGPLYFNLGNAYFKDGKLGEAILNYKRAKRLMPRDADLNANLRFARAKVKGGQLRAKGIWKWRPLRMYAGNLTVNELLWLSSGMYLFIVVLLFMSVVFAGKRRFLTSVAVLAAVMVLLNSAVAFRKINVERKMAVVVVPSVDAKFGPFETATKFFNLDEGMIVLVVAKKDDWRKVERSDGKTGWVKANEVEKVR